MLSAHTRSSRESPAYFIVRTNTGPVSLYTSSSVDWVMEYIDEAGVHHTVNAHGSEVAERLDFNGKGKTLYFKIYPQKSSDSTEAFLYGQNVQSLRTSTVIPSAFAALETPAPAGTPETPLPPGMGMIALGIAFILVRRGI
jgi:hypothetical protein